MVNFADMDEAIDRPARGAALGLLRQMYLLILGVIWIGVAAVGLTRGLDYYLLPLQERADLPDLVIAVVRRDRPGHFGGDLHAAEEVSHRIRIRSTIGEIGDALETSDLARDLAPPPPFSCPEK